MRRSRPVPWRRSYLLGLLGLQYHYHHLVVPSQALSMSASSSKSMTSTSPVTRGAFIVLEGVDRCGKTTQVARLVERLAQDSSSVQAMRFPDRTTPIGRIINEYLQSSSSSDLNDAAIHLLFSANRWEATKTIQSHLQQGTNIVCDRYVHSGVAFSAAKVIEEQQESTGRHNNNDTAVTTTTTLNDDGTTPLLSLDWCRAPDQGLPDCVIFLDMSPEQAQERGGYVMCCLCWSAVVRSLC